MRTIESYQFMENPLISCIVPVFNGERYLGQALESILAQTYRPIEVIVVDDGSVDGTHQLVASYGDRVRYVFQPNAGPPRARNLGLSMAQGEFVAFLDADDLWQPDKLSFQMACFRERPELDLCVTHCQVFWIPELQEEEARFRDHRLSRPLPGYVTQTLLARRALFDAVGNFDASRQVGDPADWFLRAAEHGATIELLPDVLVYRRFHKNNFSVEADTRRMKPSMQDAILQVVKASLDRRRRQNQSAPVPLKFSTIP
jgi:glycosyltransferase involved in cell wall biosynthesis